MKKVIIFSLMFAMTFAMSGMAMASTEIINTGLTRDTSGGAAPIVKAKWEANADRYTDASSAAGAQLMPSGQYGVNKTIAMCAVVADPDGLSDVLNVYADVFYPEGIALGDSHVALPDQSGLGCGEFMQEDSLTRLDKQAGIDLFCGNVRNSNNNLPTFNTGYDYDEICAADGELLKDTAAVYCGTKDLSYEDPSGDYEVWAVVQDTNGLQGILENQMTYLPLTAFETDFSSINYGNVRLNIHKIISGDLTWDAMDQGRASVRNVGNTRLAMTISQDDMGLGQTDGLWNVEYDARVGSLSTYSVYDPEETVTLDDELDLSELDEMDFSIAISKFPPTYDSSSYVGTMTLGAVMADHLECELNGVDPETRNISLENKTVNWEIISNDQTYGDISYSHNDTTFHGLVTGTGLIAGGKYQITFNGQADCPTFTAASLAGAGSNAFESGYWNGGPNLDPVCVAGGEGVFNIDLIGDHYTFIADGSGAFNHPFSLNLPAGDYVDVKVLVKKMLDAHAAPWADTGAGYPMFNLYETASIDFTVLP